jgi:hypothetical protein
MCVSTDKPNPRSTTEMITNRIRTIARNAAGTAVLASGLGLAAFGLAGTANAAPVNHAPERVFCQVYYNGVPVYWYWGPCR